VPVNDLASQLFSVMIPLPLTSDIYWHFFS